jgi:3alpha(or 20beta)-hydroxysteroid dehydrogenase
MNLAGHIVVITGGAQGQGAAEALMVASAGATAVVTDILDAEAMRLVEDIRELGLTAVYRHLDVTSQDDWTQCAEWLRTDYGHVDGLVNNAGTLSAGRVGEAATVAEWDRVMAVNVKGPLLAMTALTPLMGAGASIINVGSSAGLTAHYRVAYTASKWALRGLARCAALELGPRGIRVNTILPGMIDTPMTAHLASVAKQAQLDETPLGRAGTVDDVAAVVRFLLSAESAFLCGAEISVDGGFTSHGGVKSISDAARAAGHG